MYMYIHTYIHTSRSLYIPGHALHEKGLQRQEGAGPLVGSQERRAAVVPLINRGSNAGFVPPPVYMAFRLFVLLKKRSGQVCSMPWRVRGSVVSWANRFVGVPFCPVPPHPAVPPCAAPTRRARGMSGFWIRQVHIYIYIYIYIYIHISFLPSGTPRGNPCPPNDCRRGSTGEILPEITAAEILAISADRKTAQPRTSHPDEPRRETT